MSEQNYIVKINTALSNKPFFVKIDNPEMSIDRIITEAIDTLENTGKPLESQQLQQLYDTHQILNNSQSVTKGTLFTELITDQQEVAGQQIEIAELNLVTSHSGGG